MLLFITYIWTFILRLKYKKKEAFSKVLSNNYPLRSSMDSAYDHPDYPLWFRSYESHSCTLSVMENLLNVLPLWIFNKIISQLVAMILLSCYSDSDLAQHLDQLGCSTYSTWLCKKFRAYAFHGFLPETCLYNPISPSNKNRVIVIFSIDEYRMISAWLECFWCWIDVIRSMNTLGEKPWPDHKLTVT